jgi:hypothetical protein
MVRGQRQPKACSFYYSGFSSKRLEDKDNKKLAHFTIFVFRKVGRQRQQKACSFTILVFLQKG